MGQVCRFRPLNSVSEIESTCLYWLAAIFYFIPNVLPFQPFLSYYQILGVSRLGEPDLQIVDVGNFQQNWII